MIWLRNCLECKVSSSVNYIHRQALNSLSNTVSVRVLNCPTWTLALARPWIYYLSTGAAYPGALTAAFVIVETFGGIAALGLTTSAAAGWRDATRYPVAEAAFVICVRAGVGVDALLACLYVLALLALAREVVNEVTLPKANFHPSMGCKLEDKNTSPAPPSYFGKAGWDFTPREFVTRPLPNRWIVELIWNGVDHSLGAILTTWRWRWSWVVK